MRLAFGDPKKWSLPSIHAGFRIYSSSLWSSSSEEVEPDSPPFECALCLVRTLMNSMGLNWGSRTPREGHKRHLASSFLAVLDHCRGGAGCHVLWGHSHVPVEGPTWRGTQASHPKPPEWAFLETSSLLKPAGDFRCQIVSDLVKSLSQTHSAFLTHRNLVR